MAQPDKAAQKPDDPDALEWFHVEIIIFERLTETDTSTNSKAVNEKVVLANPRSLPTGIIALGPYTDDALGPVNAVQAAAVNDSMQGDIWDNYGQEQEPFQYTRSFQLFGEWLSVTIAASSHQELLDALDDPDALAQYWPYVPQLVAADISPEPALPTGENSEENPTAATDARSSAPSIPAILGFRVLTEKDLRLRREAERLNRHKSYRLLFHRAWRQPMPVREQALPVLISTESDTMLHARVEGHLSLGKSKFMHLHGSIWLSERTSVGPEEQQPNMPVSYLELAVEEQVRSNVLHYFDHPEFGMLVQIRPYRPNSAEIASALAGI